VFSTVQPQARASQQCSYKPLIVMVHGGFHWGGCFEKVVNLLGQRGYAVVTPDNLSHGYDATPYNSVKDMGDYCSPVERIVAAANAPVVLIGHSLGGLTLSYLGEKYPQKIRRLIYLSAIMCPHGESLLSYMALDRNLTFKLPPVFDRSGPADGMTLKMSDPSLLKSVFYGDCSDRDVRVALANLNVTDPLAPWQWISTITPRNFGSIPRLYVECSEDSAIPLNLQRRFQQDVPGAMVRTLTTSHSPFFSHPDAVADLIDQVA